MALSARRVAVPVNPRRSSFFLAGWLALAAVAGAAAAPAPAGDDAMLRAALVGYYAAYASSNVDTLMAAWSPGSPDREAAQSAISKLFADHGRVSARGLDIRR